MMKFKAFVLIIFFICFSEISISHENKIAYLDQKSVITKEEFEKKIINLRNKASVYRKERNENLNNLNNQRLDATTKMISLIRPILSDYSEANSISLIIQKRNIIIGKTSLDITNDILKIVDENIKKISVD